MKNFFLLLLLTSCTSQTFWKVDSIATGNSSFDSTRLSYQSPSSPLRLEWIRYSQEFSCFLSLTQFRFHADPPIVKAQFTIEEEILEEDLPLTQGQMRLRLPFSTAQFILSALLDGKKVGILIDGFEETLFPENFQKVYEEWRGDSSFLKALLKGPL